MVGQKPQRSRAALELANQLLLLHIVEPGLPPKPGSPPQRFEAAVLKCHGPTVRGLPTHAHDPCGFGLTHAAAEQLCRLEPPSFECVRVADCLVFASERSRLPAITSR